MGDREVPAEIGRANDTRKAVDVVLEHWKRVCFAPALRRTWPKQMAHSSCRLLNCNVDRFPFLVWWLLYAWGRNRKVTDRPLERG